MIRIRSLAILLIAFVCSSLPALAHSGHAMHEAELGHLLTSPFHLGVLALFGMTCVSGALFVKRTLPRRALQSLGLVLVLTAAIVYGASV